MIKFENLERVCKELDFKLDKKEPFVFVIDRCEYEVIFLGKDNPWSICFYARFDWLDVKEKEKLIKAITKDYEIAKKELEDAENNNM